MRIRSATLADASAIARVHVESSWSTYRGILPDEVLTNYSYERRTMHWSKVIGNPESTEFVIVAEDEQGQIVGFTSGGPEREGMPFTGEIYTLYPLSSAQRQGLGRRLMAASMHRLIKQGMKKIVVWVLADNPACTFYEALGGHFFQEKLLQRGDKLLRERSYIWENPFSVMETTFLPEQAKAHDM